MLDIKHFRNNLAATAERLTTRGYKLDVEKFTELENQRKSLQIKTQELQNERNDQSKKIGQLKASGGDITALMAHVKTLGDQLKSAEQNLEVLLQALNEILHGIPNLPHPSVPIGHSEKENKEIRRSGTPREFNFTPKDHVDLGQQLGMMDFDLASKIAGARFVVMQGPLVKLHRSLIQFMIDVHTTQHGYREIYVPYMANKDSLFGTGQLPKFAEDQFAIKGEQGYYLIATAEISVTNIARNEILPAESLPRKYVCHTPCFRSEAGSYGKDTRGMIRQHQFEKVELVQLVKPEDSYTAHEQLTTHAEKILDLLELPYRRMLLCTGDTGFCSAKTYDLEVWLPAQQCYREISSCSNFEDFQARRMQARYRDPVSNKPELIHTINGSGLAVGRTLVAIMENYQDEQGKIHIPKALQSYMGGLQILS